MYEAQPNAPIDSILLAAETAIVNMKRRLAAAPTETENYKRAVANLNALIGLYNAYEANLTNANQRAALFKKIADTNARSYFEELDRNEKLNFELLIANLTIDELQTKLRKYEPRNEPSKCQLKP